MKKLLFFFSLAMCGVSQAAPVVWTFENVRFEDGGVLQGSFTYDADTFSVSSVDFRTTARIGSFSGSSYDLCVTYCDIAVELFPGGQALAFGNTALEPDGPPNAVRFLAVFDSFLTNAGGRVDLRPGTCFLSCEAYLQNNGTSAFRPTRSGYLVGEVVPVPAAVWLFGSALAALSGMRRKKP